VCRVYGARSGVVAASRLACFRKLTQAEIATRTRIPLGTVKAHIQRAQAKLRDALGSDLPNPLLR
jgi:DNA-directed RNA polymerase specialized sigma24 family protein